MFDNLIFYNAYGAGDIFESREFVKDYMKLIPAQNYWYAHGKNPRILLDMPELKFAPFDSSLMDSMRAFRFDHNNLFINTWIGRDSRYVLPGIGCVVEMLYRMHNDILFQLGCESLPRKTIDYIPDIDYSYYKTDRIDLLLRGDPRKKIYVSNGPVQSCQAYNFDMNPAIDILVERNPDALFILTQKMGLEPRDGLLYTEDIIGDVGGFDLNECSYLSTYCDILVGRNSGPHVFSQVKTNWMNPNKRIISFTYKEIAATFVLRQPVLMEKYWTYKSDTQGVVDFIQEVLNQ